MPKLFGPDTVVVPMQNGIPYWYFHKHGGPLEGRPVNSVDPTGVIGKHIPCERVIGCVVYPATELVASGRHQARSRAIAFRSANPTAATSERVKRVSECFIRGGLQSPVLAGHPRRDLAQALGQPDVQPDQRAVARDARRHLPVSAEPRTRAADMMSEAQAIANKLGITFRVPIEKRIAGAERVGHHKTSMLQDVEAGRTLEIDALLGSVIELGRHDRDADPAPRHGVRADQAPGQEPGSRPGPS